jgi:hypothetical protein
VDTIKRIINDLGILPDHDIMLFIGVEGSNDINFFREISKVLAKSEQDIPDLELLEKEGKILFIPLGGSNVALWTDRLKGFNRPEIHLFDRDTIPPSDPKYKNVADEINKRENSEAIITSKLEIENYLHPRAINLARPEVVVTFEDFDDVPSKVAEYIHNLSNSPKTWASLDEETKKKKESTCKKWLNSTAVTFMTPDLLSEQDPKDDIRNVLRRVYELIQNPLYIDTVKSELVDH